MMDSKKQGFNFHGCTVTVGVDWADEAHDYYAVDHETERLWRGTFSSQPQAVKAWIEQLKKECPGQSIAIAMELKRGALVYQLTTFEGVKICPVQTTAIKNYRKALDPSGRKNDPTDASHIHDFAIKHPQQVRVLKILDEPMERLGRLNEGRRKQVERRAHRAQQLVALLKDLYPQALSLFPTTQRYAVMFLDFLERWPSFSELSQVPEEEWAQFGKSHRCGSAVQAERWQKLRASCTVSSSSALLDESVLMIRSMIRELRVLNQSVQEYEQEIEKAYRACETACWGKLPGAGKALAPRLLGLFGDDPGAERSAEEWAVLTGIAPVTIKSGKGRSVHFRSFASKFHRQTVHEFANFSRKKSQWAEAFYQYRRAKGDGHHDAIRKLAYKWLRILQACWREKQAYQETLYLQALRRRGSPLLDYLEEGAEPPASK